MKEKRIYINFNISACVPKCPLLPAIILSIYFNH